MLDPFILFVTEEVYQAIDSSQSIVVSEWPTVDEALSNEESNHTMGLLVDIIKSVRQTRNEVNTPLSKPIDIKIEIKDSTSRQLIEEKTHYITRFTNTETLEIGEKINIEYNAITQVVNGTNDLFFHIV